MLISSSTKRLIVDVIRFQPGDTLTEILESSASPEQVRKILDKMCFRVVSEVFVPIKGNLLLDANSILDESTWVPPDHQELEYQRAMHRRAIRDAKTPEKMKHAKPVVDDSLTLQGKKDKIRSNLQRLSELGRVHPENRYQDLINDIAKVKPTAG